MDSIRPAQALTLDFRGFELQSGMMYTNMLKLVFDLLFDAFHITALGAAYLAGLAVGYWQSAEDITRNWSVDRVFCPAISEEERTKRIKGWNKAVRCAYHWARDEEE